MRVRIKYKYGALYKIRSGDRVQSELESRATKIAAAANRMDKTTGYKTSSRQGAKRPFGRWRTTVITASAEAMRKNAKRNTLVRALYNDG